MSPVIGIGRRIRQARLSRGLTQAELAGRELSKGFISLLEADRTQPSVETLWLLARRLGTSLDALVGGDSDVPQRVGSGLLALVRQALRNRDFGGAGEFLKAARLVATRYGLRELERDVLLLEGQAALDDRQLTAAWTTLEEAVAVSEAGGDVLRASRGRVLQGRVKVRQRELPAAMALLTQALRDLKGIGRIGDPIRADAHIAIGTTTFALGDFDQALRSYEEAAESEAARYDPVLRDRAAWGIGLVHRKLGNHAAAEEWLLKARDALEAAEELRDLVRVLKNIGELLHGQERHAEALVFLSHALRVMDRLEMRVDRVSVLVELGRVHWAMGNVDDARHFAEQALAEAREVRDPVEIAEAQVVLARVRDRLGDRKGAIEHLTEALNIFRERSMGARIVEAARELGLLLRAEGEHAKAADYFALALSVTT